MTEAFTDTQLMLAGSVVVAWLSRRPLRHPGSHGFYRFFAWEGILALVVINREPWGMDPFSPHQVVSWLLLLASIALVALGAAALLARGTAGGKRRDGALYDWERTTALVTTGIFAHIRHPMYASLLALAWGIFFQGPSWPGIALAAVSSLFLGLTATADERECLAWFGQPYADYMRRTPRRFVPGVF
jgi:protein-S-isoprenylcysteine O-methyltransferase Ste14